MEIQPEVKVKSREREGEKRGERETWGEPESQETRPRDLFEKLAPILYCSEGLLYF